MAEDKGFARLKADLKAEQLQNIYIFLTLLYATKNIQYS